MRPKSIKSRAIPGFSVLKMKQEIQEQIYRETEGMTDEEVREYFRQASERAERRREIQEDQEDGE